MTTVERLKKLRAKRSLMANELEVIDAEIANLVRQALSEGIGPTKLAAELEITRGRIYQIRDGR